MDNSINIDLKDLSALEPKQQVMVILLFCLLLLMLAYALDIHNIQKKLAVSQKSEQDLKDQFESLQAMQAAVSEDVSALPKIKVALTEWTGRLVQPSGLSDLINDILKLGTNNNLQFDSFSPGEEVKQDSYMKLPIKVTASGSYDDIANFISQVANMDKIVSISDFIISKNTSDELASKGNVSNHLTATLTFEVYHVAAKSV